MCVYCHHAIINFVIKLVIQERKRVKLAIVQVFDWLSKYEVYYFMYE